MVTRAFGKHLRSNPVPDEDILAALEWVEAIVKIIRGEDGTTVVSDVENELTLIAAE